MKLFKLSQLHEIVVTILYKAHLYKYAYRYAEKYCEPGHWLNYNDEPFC